MVRKRADVMRCGTAFGGGDGRPRQSDILPGGVEFKQGSREMSSSPAEADEAPDLVCRLDSVQGMVDALSSVRWKRNQVPPSSPARPCYAR